MITKIWDYLDFREQFVTPLRRQGYRSPYHDLWSEDDTLKFHHTLGALRDLDMNPLTLKKYDSRSYMSRDNRPQNVHPINRHHMYRRFQHLIDLDILVNVPRDQHFMLEGWGSDVQSILYDRLRCGRDIPNYYTNSPHPEARSQLSQNMFVRREDGLGWDLVPVYELRWEEFLRRRDMVSQPGGIEKFLREECKELVDRWFSEIPEGQLEIAIREMIWKWIKAGNEIPILPSYLHMVLIEPLISRSRYLGRT